MEPNNQYFHFTLGPVQGFVAQARRTRDFWGGSFILSWLSAVAMKSVIAQQGEILFPRTNENFLLWLEGKGTENKPIQGCIPNRLKARVGQNFVPQRVMECVQSAWYQLALRIYNKDIKKYANDQTHIIWDRQIKHFWEMNWVLTDDVGDSAALDRRKNWRTHYSPDEPGVKCMMMAGWQELSNTPKPQHDGLEAFWKRIRESGNKAMKTDLREGEYLCAIAFVKRRFVHYFDTLKIDMPDNWTLHGWSLKSGVPSVAYMAAVHWLEAVLNKADINKVEIFHDAAKKLTEGYGEWANQIRCIETAWGKKQWKAIDGNVFFQNVLENKKVYSDVVQAEKTIAALKALTSDIELSPVSPFYAILMMDGDSLGKHMSDTDKEKQKEKQQAITSGLAEFTSEVAKTVYNNNGFLVYAGGDDVLAVLPLEDALRCASQLRQCYLACFANKPELPMTISGAIIYAHIKMPLSKVLHEAHHLLDKVAKDQYGRDALAVQVWKPGGQAIEWAAPWEIALESDTTNNERHVIIGLLAEQFQQADEQDHQFANRFFYRIRERFSLLNPPNESADAVLNKEEAIDLMAMEYLNSGKVKSSLTFEDARQQVSPLLQQCRPVFRELDQADPEKWEPSKHLLADGALLVRFLARKGVER